jgi:hypothetical protein
MSISFFQVIKGSKPHRRGIMLKLPFTVTAVILALSIPATGPANAQKAPPELPLAIFCWSEQTKTWVVGNLATIKEDGTATYVGANGRLSGTLNAKGVVEPPSNRPVAIDCYGKTLDQLRAIGRLIELPRTR